MKNLKDNKFFLYINTIKYLRFSQVYYRVKNIFTKKLYSKGLFKIKTRDNWEINDKFIFSIPELDYDDEFLNRFNINDIFINKFKFINITKEVDLEKAWLEDSGQHLWRFNLHYFDYIYKLTYDNCHKYDESQRCKKYKDLIESWIDKNPFPIGDGWHPYTISLRLTNWIITYQSFKLDSCFAKKFKDSIYLQYKYLQNNIEKDVLGNHYFENIKAIIVGSIFFKDEATKKKYIKELLKQLEEQILKDGMHFELSPMYHKIVLENLIKITFWLKDNPVFEQLITYIQKMLDAIYSLESNFGKTPSFNDSTDGISKSLNCLVHVCEKYFGLKPNKCFILGHSGFYILENENMKLIFDVGDISPTYLPAHGHCDALSYEMSVDGRAFIVNSGTYIYEVGEWRNYFRSTISHNTVVIDDKEQSQFWSSFRIAKRIKNVRRNDFFYKDIHFYGGAYISHSGDRHKRYIGMVNKNKIIVVDCIKAISAKNTRSFIHFTSNTKMELCNDCIYASKYNIKIRVTPMHADTFYIEQGWHSNQFNLIEGNEYIVIEKKKSTEFFGYMIELNPNENEVICNEEIMNFEELGDFL